MIRTRFDLFASFAPFADKNMPKRSDLRTILIIGAWCDDFAEAMLSAKDAKDANGSWLSACAEQVGR